MEAKSDNPNFIGALALYQHRRDSALGLIHPTQQQRGLLWFYSAKQKELLADYSKASFVKGAISQIDRRMAEIMVEVEQANLERKRELLAEALNLKRQARRIMKHGR